jgi:hypothetical protein
MDSDDESQGINSSINKIDSNEGDKENDIIYDDASDHAKTSEHDN